MTGSAYEPNVIKMRIILGLMSYFSTLIFAYYSAILISILMVNKRPPPFHNYASLYQTDYDIGYRAGTSMDEIFENGNEIMRKMYHTRFKFFDDYTEMEKYAVPNHFAMIQNVDYANAKFGSTCEFTAIESFQIKHSAWTIFGQKKSPYIPLIKYQ